jgi:ankyrin repeat protein
MKSPETVFAAVESGDLKRLKELIKSGADVNEFDEETALAKAAGLGRADMVRELLKAGADANMGGLQSPLCVAAHAGSKEIVELMLKAGADVNSQSEGGESALMFAAAKGDLNLVKHLLKAGANAKLEDKDGRTAILYGSKWPKVVAVLKPLSLPEHVEYVAKEARKSAENVEALLAAAKAGDTKGVQTLLDAGTPVNGANKSDETALHFAVEARNGKLVELLLKAGADVNARNSYGRSPLWEAAGGRDLKIIERLIKSGADVNARERLEGKTPFLNSIGPKPEHRDTMRLLAKHGADVKAADNYGRTALALADRYLSDDPDADKEERNNSAALRELLMELGVLDRNADAFTKAAADGNLEAVCKFLGNGVPVDAMDAQERTALYMAVSRQHIETVRQLLKAGADVHKAIGQDKEQDVQWGGTTCACPGCGHSFSALLAERRCPKCGKSFAPQKQFGSKLDGELCFTWGNGHLPLMVAARLNNPEIITALISAGADANRGKDGITPLMVAAYFGHLEAARALVKYGADVKREGKTPDRLKKTISPVLLAAGNKHIAMVKLLWDSGAPAKDKKPTLLVAAADRGDTKEIMSLLADGADPNAEDPLTKEWPLCAAANSGYPAAVEVLLKAGASAKPAPRQTAPLLVTVGGLEHKMRLEQATTKIVDNYVHVAKLLLAAGAKPSVSFFGVSPLSLAEDMKCEPLIQVLKSGEQKTTKSKGK